MNPTRPLTPKERLAGRAYLEAVALRLQHDPLLLEYVRWMEQAKAQNRAFCNTEPWQAVAECRQCQLTIITAALWPERLRAAHAPVRISPHDDEESRLLSATAYFFRLQAAQCYLWSHLIHAHVRGSPPLPRHTISSTILPYPDMFWSREGAVGDDAVPYESNFVLINHERGGFSFTVDCSPNLDHPHPTQETFFSGIFIRYGTTYPDDFAHDKAVLDAVEYILKALAFLNSPFVDIAKKRVPRTFRKDLTKMGAPTTYADPLIHTVVLRQPEKHPLPGSTEECEFTRRHHWWVAGHYRAQWYPSKQEHKVIWIAPHLRGDTTLPLLEKVYAVQR